ncbi:MAG: hypothetical protein COY68_04685 [Candidatus Levybacteria bacterium CG_4_10_14_0_8_um_filter_35_23]|nr:MAG: hypothetical protein COY68_04685 [Candidatus Levybacteria bacterium CG_4_10_14_0_8_um_filter_35_23]
MDSKNQAIIKTLIYSDIFDFPLTKQEIWKYLISNKKISQKDFLKLLKNKKTLSKNNFYFLKGREEIIRKRKDRKKIGVNKIEKAKKIINLISIIPSIYLVGITGSLALLNSEKKEDIDIFLISSKGTVWITRFLAVIILKLSGNYRSRTERNVEDKICLNMIIGEDCLNINNKRQDLYTAHEIIQLLPIFERNNTYKQFLNNNLWIKRFMPNCMNKENIKINRKKEIKWLVSMLKVFEPFIRKLQFSSMEKYITRETVLDNFLAFHPIDYRGKIIKEFKQRIKND